MDETGHEFEQHRAPFMMKEMREAILAEEQNPHNQWRIDQRKNRFPNQVTGVHLMFRHYRAPGHILNHPTDGIYRFV